MVFSKIPGVEEFAMPRRVGGGTGPGRLLESARSADRFVRNQSTAKQSANRWRFCGNLQFAWSNPVWSTRIATFSC